MNTRLFPSRLLACAGISIALAASAFSQAAAPSPTTASPSPEGKGQEMRQRIMAAKKKAMEDPKIQQLHDQYFNALKEGMIKADPGLKDSLQNFGKPDGQCMNKGAGNKVRGDGKMGGGKLSDADKQKLKAARAAAENDPSVIAAQTRKNVATNPAEKDAARKEYHKALRAAMIKNDPSIAALLEKKYPSKEDSSPTQ